MRRGRGGALPRLLTRPGRIVRAALLAVAGGGLIAAGLQALPAAADAAPSHQVSVQDRLDDVVGLHNAAVTLPAADITKATLEYGPGWIRAEVGTFNSTDPVRDPHWQSDNTFAVWTLDTNADGAADYLVEYGISAGKELYGDVLRPDAAPGSPALCSADSVTYSSSVLGGDYTLRLDPACIGNPAAIAWTVGFSYESGGGLLGTDIVPDRGFAAAVSAPSPTPAFTTPTNPTTVTTAPIARTRHRSVGPRPVTELPRTGSGRVLPLSGVGLGVLLMGAGLRVMVPPGHRRLTNV